MSMFNSFYSRYIGNFATKKYAKPNLMNAAKTRTTKTTCQPSMLNSGCLLTWHIIAATNEMKKHKTKLKKKAINMMPIKLKITCAPYILFGLGYVRSS